jgi:hypothetical protein
VRLFLDGPEEAAGREFSSLSLALWWWPPLLLLVDFDECDFLSGERACGGSWISSSPAVVVFLSEEDFLGDLEKKFICSRR